jgi:hypothetical protein
MDGRCQTIYIWRPHTLAPMQDRLVDEAGVNAIICLQSDVCHDALQIGCAH